MIERQTATRECLGNAIALSSMGPWILLKTKWCREYQALDNLRRLGVTAYLPRLPQLRRAGFRRNQPQPMFPGYIFASCNGFALPTVYGISGPVMFGSRIAHVEDEIIDELRRQEIQLNEKFDAPQGSQVKVVSGPFAHAIGELVRLKSGNKRAVVLLKLLDSPPRQVELSARDLKLA